MKSFLFFEATPFGLKRHSTKSRIGVVINVVTSAMITNITNIEGGRTPSSYPILSATSSISPRVFINVPIMRLSFQFSPTSLAAILQPPIFPTTATNISKRQTNKSSGVFIRPISVRKPVKAKNNGRKNTNATSSTFSIITFLNPKFEGITTPAMKAPNRA